VRDDASDASANASFEGTHIQFRFKGRLDGTSIQHTFVSQPVSIGLLEGDFSIDGDRKHFKDSTRSGFLRGTKVHLPPELPIPLTIEQISLEAKGPQVLIKTATVSSGQSRVDISGSIAYVNDKLWLDADVRGDTVVVPVMPSQAGTSVPAKAGSESAETSVSAKEAELLAQLWDLPLGLIRIDIRRLSAGTFEVAPLVASVTLQETVRDVRIQRAALCGITLEGSLSGRRGSAVAEAKLSARGAQLEQSIRCLTNQRVQATGKVDLDGEFSSSGERSKGTTLLDNLRGTFALTARDGHINKADTLASVLKVVNLSEAVHGALPDLSKAGLDYKSAHVQGRLQGRKIFLSEMGFDAPVVTIAAHGNIDLVTGGLDGDMLVAPFKASTSLLSYIPILRTMFGGMLIAIPVHVGGTLDNPIVVPLGPQAVASRLVDIMGNTIRLPGEAIKLVSPGGGGTGQSSPANPQTGSR